MLSVFVLPVNKVFATSTIEDSETKSMQRLMDLGIFAKTNIDKMYLSNPITREQLAVVLVMINGQQEKLDLFRNTSLFNDVKVSSWSNPYINVAVKSGYMNAKSGGIFSPLDKVSFLSLGEVLGKLLKYDDAYLPGSSNDKYLVKLVGLGILDSINYSSSAYVTRGQIALMLDRMLSTRVFGTDTKFIDTIPVYKKAIVIENSIINTSADDRQVITDKGIFFLKEGITIPEAGKQYYLKVKDNDIQYAALSDYQYKEYSLSSFKSGTVTTNEGKKVKLPAGIDYYYQGNLNDYALISQNIHKNSSVIIAYDGKEDVYGVLFDPLQSKPEVTTTGMAGKPLGTKYEGLLIDRGGKYILGSQIEVDDVVYKVTDIWNKNPYVIVYDNSVSGKITGIYPSIVSPNLIEIDGISYELDDNFNKNKFRSTGKVQVGETAKLVLGPDGKAVDMISETIDGTEKFVLVLNAYTENSKEVDDYGNKYYYATVLHSDGGKKTYLTEKSMLHLRGNLARYEVIATGEDYDTVKLNKIENDALESYTINKDERRIGDDYVANGAVLFNIENTVPNEIEASVITFSDLYETNLMDGTVKYIHRSGDFMDIDVMLLDDALWENTAYGLVIDKSVVGNQYAATETLTLMVNNKIMTYTGKQSTLYIGSVAKVKLNSNTNNLQSIKGEVDTEISSRKIQAIDSSRIRIEDKVYSYHSSLAIYKRISGTSWKVIEPSDLKKEADNRTVFLYLDKPLKYGGKVVVILVR